MSDRPTPETDAAIYPMEQVDVIWPDFARKLERERDQAREEAKRLDGAYEDATNYYARIIELTDERDEARRKLNNLDVTAIHSCHNECQKPICVLRRERDEAREALKRIYQASIVAQSLEEDFAEWEKAIEMLLDLIKKEAH